MPEKNKHFKLEILLKIKLKIKLLNPFVIIIYLGNLQYYRVFL